MCAYSVRLLVRLLVRILQPDDQTYKEWSGIWVDHSLLVGNKHAIQEAIKDLKDEGFALKGSKLT